MVSAVFGERQLFDHICFACRRMLIVVVTGPVFYAVAMVYRLESNCCYCVYVNVNFSAIVKQIVFDVS
jgi:hypothetical protein